MSTTDLRACLLYTSDAADERSSVDLGGRRIIKKKKSIVADGVCERYIEDLRHNEVHQSKVDDLLYQVK